MDSSNLSQSLATDTEEAVRSQQQSKSEVPTKVEDYTSRSRCVKSVDG